jgi:hypothetical protein
MTLPSDANLTLIAEMIADAHTSDPTRTAENIRELHKTEQGAEICRRILMWELGGEEPANVIANALWDAL